MLTSGSKLFIGATTFAVLAAVVTGAAQTGPDAWTASIGLVGAVVALLTLAAAGLRFRDHTVATSAPAAGNAAVTAGPEVAAAASPLRRSIVPVAAAIGAGVVVVGLATRPGVVIAGVLVVLAASVEWLRASIRARPATRA